MNEKTAELMKAFSTDEFERKTWEGYAVYIPRITGENSGTNVLILENGDTARLSSLRESFEFGEYAKKEKKNRTGDTSFDFGA